MEEALPGGAGELQVEVSPAGEAGMDSTGERGSGDDTKSGPVIVRDEAMLRGKVIFFIETAWPNETLPPPLRIMCIPLFLRIDSALPK